MKIILLIILLTITGCGKSAYMSQQLEAYNQSMAVLQRVAAARASQPPMVSVSFHQDGRLASLAVSQPIEYPNIPTFRPSPHPGWNLGQTAIRAAGTVGGIFAGGWAISELADTLADAVGTTYNGEFHGPINSSGNFSPYGQYAGRDGIFNPVTVGRDGNAIQVPIQPNAPIEISPPPEPEPEPPPPEEPPPEEMGVRYGQFTWSTGRFGE